MALRTPLTVSPHMYIGDSTGRPLDLGAVYFGEADKDPEFYPIDIFSDDELLIPIAQPVRTKGGYLSDKGDNVEVHAQELIYSVKVLDQYGRKIFYKGQSMRNNWNDDVIDQINTAIIGSADIASDVAEKIAREAIEASTVDGSLVTDALTKTVPVALGGIARNQAAKNAESVNIKDFGGICDGTLHTAAEWVGEGKRFADLAALKVAYPSAIDLTDSIDTLAIEAALKSIGNTGQIKLLGRPVFNRTVNLNGFYMQGIRIYADSLTVVKFVHGGDGFNLEGENAAKGANYGKHVLENIDIDGGDPLFPPAGYVRNNSGSGIRVRNSYYNTFINVKSRGFKNGIYIRQGFRNNCVGECAFYGNEVGVNIDGEASNLNDFSGARIRMNWVGVILDGFNKGVGYYPTRNKFNGAYIETNIKYLGGYLPSPNDGSYNVGIKIRSSYHNDFTGVYFENQEYDIWLENNASRNKFISTRHGAGADLDKSCQIMFKGAGVSGNIFRDCDYQKYGSNTVSSVKSDNASQFGNKFLDCDGFLFRESDIACYDNLTIRAATKQGQINGDSFGAMTREPSGYNVVGNSTTAGNLEGIGTTTATLHAKGFGELLLGGAINSPTTITNITGLRKGQIFVLNNYQITHPVTIKASTDGINGLVLNGRKDCVLKSHSDSITFQVSGLGKIVEIGRTVAAGSDVGTWTPIVTNSGGVPLAGATTTGRYVKNGNQMTVWFTVSSSSDMSETLYYSITGMPNLPQFSLKGAGTAASSIAGGTSNQANVFSVDAQLVQLTVRTTATSKFDNSDTFSGTATYIIA